MLLNYTKKELEQLAKIYEVKGGYKLKKAELTEILLEMIPENMDKALVNLDTKDLEAFEEIIKEEKWIDNIEETTEYLNLKSVGLIKLSNEEGKVKVEVEPCIKAAYEKLDMTAIKEGAKCNSHLKTHIVGILNLYGAVELAWVEKLYNRDNEDKIDVQDIISFIETDRELASRVQISHGYIADETVYAVDESNLSAFIKATEDKPYYVPTKEYIELISDEDYYDNTLQVQKLKSYIKKHFTQEEEIIEEAIMAVAMIARVDCSPEGATTDLMLEEWSCMGIEITNPMGVKEVTEHILAVADTTRKWINRGFTNNELRPAITTQQTVVRKLDIGRNAACPCGSGKKYKKCCGRN